MAEAQRTTIDTGEVARFSALAAEWWNPNGKFRPLHKFNPVRLVYIRDHVAERFGRDPREARPFEGLRILDIGCGGGLLCEPMARLGASVVGADAAATNIEVARLHAEQSGVSIDYRNTTAEELAEAGEKFDVVLNMEVVEHVSDVDFYIAKCAEMVKPGGIMFIATINRTLKALGLAIIGAEYVLRWLPRGTHQFHKLVRPDELEKALAPTGMTIIDRTGVVYNPLADRWHLSKDMDVNYMVLAERPGDAAGPRSGRVTFLQYRCPGRHGDEMPPWQRRAAMLSERRRLRRLALQMPEAEEKSHFGKADFRVRNHIFSTLPDADTAVVKLTHEQQEMLTGAEPAIFAPVPGGWGRQGWTRVMLAAADELTLRSALVDGLAKRRSSLAAQGVRCLQPEGNEMSGQPQASSEKPAGPLASPGPWNLVAEGYEEITRKFLEAFSRSGLAMLRYDGETRVIDVACGPGTTALLIAPAVRQYHLRRFLGGHARPASPQRRSRRADQRRDRRGRRPGAAISGRQLRPRHLDVRPDVLPRSRARDLPNSSAFLRPVGRRLCRAGRRPSIRR